MRKDGRSPPAADASALAGAGITDTAVRKATQKGWGEWYDLLDAAGARHMTHQQIVGVVARHMAGGWWQQMIAVAYEQARGLRDKNQQADGFTANSSKTINAPLARLYQAWVDEPTRARWLGAVAWTLRKATPEKSMRITWSDGRTNVEVSFSPKGDAKSMVQLQHSKLTNSSEVSRYKDFWAGRLELLRRLLELQAA